MEHITNEEKLYHQYLIRLDDELSTKLQHHAVENDMKITGVIRRSLRKYFANEEVKEGFEPAKNASISK